MTGRVGKPTGLSQAESSSTVSALTGFDPSRVAAGDWLVIRDWNIHVRQVGKVTPKLFKFGAGSNRYPTQISIDSDRILAALPDRITAERVRDSIGGIDGEFSRRRHAADQERNARVEAAKQARDKAIARLVASAIEARRAETLQDGSVHESAVPNGGTPK